ncbi:MAG: hypothetical protein ACYTHM_11440 [Planctomycetota bacterium]|jgi:hypothetical protein
MRSGIGICILLGLILSVAHAEEVTLVREEMPDHQPMSLFKNQMIQCRKLKEMPEAAKGPEGTLAWAELQLGDHKTLFCVRLEQDSAVIYFDRDRDRDLAEETPVTGRHMGRYRTRGYDFDLEDISAAFRFRNTILSHALRLRIRYPFQWGVQVFTVYNGRIEVAGETCLVTWVPGQKPVLRLPAITTGKIRDIHFGRKRVDFGGEAVQVKDGNVIATYTVADDESLVAVSVPKGLSKLNASWDTKTWTVCKPVEDKVYLSPGIYFRAEAVIEREVKGTRWWLSVMVKDFEVAEGSRFRGPIEPLSVSVSLRQRGGAVVLQSAFTDSVKRGVILYKDGEPLAPRLVIKDAEGAEVADWWLRYG